MACSNPNVKGLCGLAEESFKRVCTRCKWHVSNEEADQIRKSNKYAAKIRARKS